MNEAHFTARGIVFSGLNSSINDDEKHEFIQCDEPLLVLGYLIGTTQKNEIIQVIKTDICFILCIVNHTTQVCCMKIKIPFYDTCACFSTVTNIISCHFTGNGNRVIAFYDTVAGMIHHDITGIPPIFSGFRRAIDGQCMHVELPDDVPEDEWEEFAYLTSICDPLYQGDQPIRLSAMTNLFPIGSKTWQIGINDNWSPWTHGGGLIGFTSRPGPRKSFLTSEDKRPHMGNIARSLITDFIPSDMRYTYRLHRSRNNDIYAEIRRTQASLRKESVYSLRVAIGERIVFFQNNYTSGPAPIISSAKD